MWYKWITSMIFSKILSKVLNKSSDTTSTFIHSYLSSVLLCQTLIKKQFLKILFCHYSYNKKCVKIEQRKTNLILVYFLFFFLD